MGGVTTFELSVTGPRCLPAERWRSTTTGIITQATVGEDRPIRAGVVAGSAAAVVAALISLPLHSPDDPLLNSGTVTAGTLLAGLAAGALWRSLARFSARPRIYAVVWTLGFVLVVLVAAGGATRIERFFSYIVPLAAVVFPLVGIPTALLAGRPATNRWWLAVGALAVALALGFGLAGQGDQKSGRLSLPPRAGLSASDQAAQLEFVRNLVVATAMEDS